MIYDEKNMTELIGRNVSHVLTCSLNPDKTVLEYGVIISVKWDIDIVDCKIQVANNACYNYWLSSLTLID